MNKNVQNTQSEMESRGRDLVARVSGCSIDDFPALEAEFKALKLGAASGGVLRAWVRARSDLLYSPQFLWWMGEAREALEEGDWEQAASRLAKARELAPCSRRLARMSAWCFTVIIYSGIGETGDETLPQRRAMAIQVRDEVIPWLSVPSRILSDLLRAWSLLYQKLYRAFIREDEQQAAERECMLMAVLLSGEVEKEEFEPFTDLVRREGLAKARKANRSVYEEKANRAAENTR